MFDSFQFKENFSYFQQLLGEGVFDISLVGAKPEACKTLKRLALSNLSKSKWVECYNSLKVSVGFLDINDFMSINNFCILILIGYYMNLVYIH